MTVIDSIIKLNNIISLINYEINDIEEKSKNFFFFKKEIKNFVNDIKTEILTLKLDYQNNCNHNFIKDLIDIDPDQSREIEYCIRCEFTKRYLYYATTCRLLS
jgi:hypothetical protein